MRRIASFVCAFLAFAAPSLACAQFDRNAFLIEKGRAGPVRIGMPIEEMKAKFADEPAAHIARRVVKKDGLEVVTYAIFLSEPGRKDSESLVVTAAGDSAGETVAAISVLDPRFRTAKQIGVTSSLAQLRQAYKVDKAAATEGKSPIVGVEPLAMSFIFKATGFDPQTSASNPDAILQDSQVVEIILRAK